MSKFYKQLIITLFCIVSVLLSGCRGATNDNSVNNQKYTGLDISSDPFATTQSATEEPEYPDTESLGTYDYNKYVTTSVLSDLVFSDDLDLVNNIWANRAILYGSKIGNPVEYLVLSTCQLPQCVVDDLANGISKLPQSIIDGLYENTVLIVVTEDIQHFYSNPEAIGVTLTDGPSIVVFIEFAENPVETYSSTLLHEIGHVIANTTYEPEEAEQGWILGKQPDETEEWISIWSKSRVILNSDNKMADDLRSLYYKDDREEFFAESVFWYFDNPDTLRSELPDVYDYIDNIITHYTEYEQEYRRLLKDWNMNHKMLGGLH